ncbi:MAG: hypothetical protein WA962_03180 [Ornithinimicrobium sp.]
MTRTPDDVATPGVSEPRAIAGVLFAILAGPVAWAMWVWPFRSDFGYLPPSGYTAFFVTLALWGVLIGAVAVRRFPTLMALAAISWMSVMITLYVWWSQDETGLFMLGIVSLALPVGAAAVALLATGWGLGGRLDHRFGKRA